MWKWVFFGNHFCLVRDVDIDESGETIKTHKKLLKNYQIISLYACKYSFLKYVDYYTNNETEDTNP
ncbi:hypothetical protein [Helicobacter trogontum]|uniref:Uncharacterized protein n=1 Tax=Helicobacter trogontum TaxID=50960 RepID=A0A4U8S605_9HELI|nr:hypothetical protein [Helicobacter trogontum]TLD81206.1 hypothetical protein LS81_008885 [Helicobacter trogontum]